MAQWDHKDYPAPVKNHIATFSGVCDIPFHRFIEALDNEGVQYVLVPINNTIEIWEVDI